MGGHAVPEKTIRRRYAEGLRNFFALYQPHADTWRMYDSSLPPVPRLIAWGESSGTKVADERLWGQITRGVGRETE